MLAKLKERDGHPDPAEGCDVVIGTLGTMLSMLAQRNKVFNLSELRYIVVDEPDKLLLTKVMSLMRIIKKEKGPSDPQCQISFWSATSSTQVGKLADSAAQLLSNQPMMSMKVGSTMNKDVKHKLVACSSYELVPTLKRMLTTGEIGNLDKKYIIFATSPDMVYTIHLMLKEYFRGDEARPSIHMASGSMHASTVMKSLKNFKNSGNILVTTDLATSGYDVALVDVVLCLGLPQTAGDWVHAVGRCARAGQQGKAITVITPQCAPKLLTILDILKKTYKRHSLWNKAKASEKVLSSTEGYDSVKGQEGGAVTEGLREKHLDISPQVIELADRMGYALHVMGQVNRKSHLLKRSNVTFEAGIDKYDPSVTWMPVSAKAAIKRNAMVKKSVFKAKLSGTWRKLAKMYVANQKKGDWDKMYKANLPPVVQDALLAREAAQTERVQQLQSLKRRHIKDYRATQISGWRARMGINDAPDHTYVVNPGQAHTMQPGKRVIGSAQVELTRGRRGVPITKLDPAVQV
eukprot:TRINITY_DN1445_c0_g1_i9.p2 TRINITY_DN1445_c0_g1~~TRINITY_DN1445_c0_g1_i9.p2  ORF type:complete len:519 (+),score=155.70 TRINITY_DN1445_c0_g1_i9:310-1866(+)